MGIGSSITNAVNSILPSLYSDDVLSTSVTWKRFSDSGFDEAKGYNVETYDDFTVTAIRLEKEASARTTLQTPPGANAITLGDIVYMFRYPDLPDGISTKDLIVDGSFVYQVEKIIPVFDLVTKVEVRGYA